MVSARCKLYIDIYLHLALNSLRGFAWHKTIHYLCLHEENKPIGYCVVSNLHF